MRQLFHSNKRPGYIIESQQFLGILPYFRNSIIPWKPYKKNNNTDTFILYDLAITIYPDAIFNYSDHNNFHQTILLVDDWL